MAEMKVSDRWDIFQNGFFKCSFPSESEAYEYLKMEFEKIKSDYWGDELKAISNFNQTRHSVINSKYITFEKV